MAKKPAPSKMPVDLSVLSAEMKLRLDQEAMSMVDDELKASARLAYIEAKAEELRRKHSPQDELVHVRIDCAAFVPFIMLDGVQFFHGHTYEVPTKQAAVIYEQMARSWMHQDEIDGRGRSEAYRQPVNLVIGPQHAGSPTRGANGVITA